MDWIVITLAPPVNKRMNISAGYLASLFAKSLLPLYVNPIKNTVHCPIF